MVNRTIECQVDHFHRLPEELLVYIFTIVADLKSLCMCSLVSKHFASIISHVRTITITLPSSEAYSIESYERMSTLLHKMRSLESEQIPAYIDALSLQKLKPPVFLEKFRKLESILLEYNVPKDLGGSSLIMWKAKCSSSARIENFVALVPASVHKKSEYEVDQDQEEENDWGFKTGPCFGLAAARYMEWLCFICVLVKSRSSIQSVIVQDSDKQCKWVIKDEQLVNMKSRVSEEDWDPVITLAKSIVKIAQIPLLELPLSGYVMRGVRLMMVNPQSGEKDDITDWDLGEHRDVLGEAVKEILKNYGDKFEMLQ